MAKVYLKVYGCKVNQYEVQLMREGLEKAGYELVNREEEADYAVVNTCTVTEGSDKELEYWIRRAKRKNPQVRVLLAGCYVANHGDAIKRNPLIDGTIEEHNKSCVPQLLRRYALQDHQVFSNDLTEQERNEYYGISFFAGHMRAFVKIQDGCNKVCTFCIVTVVRGKARSRPAYEVVEEVKRLAASGYREVVLTGVQVGAYGRETGNKTALADLINRLSEITGIERLRLSSIDPLYVGDDLLELMQANPKFCNHLHISLQSGDDGILKQMKRGHNTAMFEQLITRFHEKVPGFAWSTDMIVGFPGETLRAFENSCAFLEKTAPMKIHVFPYSDREGTEAFHIKEKVALQEKRERVKKMMELESRCFQKVATNFLGRQMQVLIENTSGETGRLSNYLPVRLEGNAFRRNEFGQVKIIAIREDHLTGLAVKEQLVSCRD